MFPKALLLVLMGFMTSLPLNQAEPTQRGLEPRDAKLVECNTQFLGTNEDGTCVSGDRLNKCKKCPQRDQFLQYCVPLSDGVIPKRWQVPREGSKGTLAGDLSCPLFSRLVRKGQLFGYGCFTTDVKMTHFCGRISPRTQ
ncbi:secreted protein [Melampsora americana]|nr:secreted protein [Melampsora americana]